MLCREMDISINRCHLLIHDNSLICCYLLASILFAGVFFFSIVLLLFFYFWWSSSFLLSTSFILLKYTWYLSFYFILANKTYNLSGIYSEILVTKYGRQLLRASIDVLNKWLTPQKKMTVLYVNSSILERTTSMVHPHLV